MSDSYEGIWLRTVFDDFGDRTGGKARQFECKLYGTLPVGDGSPGSGTVVVGRIVHAHIASECFESGAVNFEKLAPMARIGGMNYEYGGSTITMPPVDYAPKDAGS